jgi:hypothetical protein
MKQCRVDDVQIMSEAKTRDCSITEHFLTLKNNRFIISLDYRKETVTFQKLEPGDVFVLPSHIATRDGVPSPTETETLELFVKNEPGEEYNADSMTKETGCMISDSTPVIKLV